MKVILFHHLFDNFGIFHGTAYHQAEYRRTTYTCRNHDVKTLICIPNKDNKRTTTTAREYRPVHRKKQCHRKKPAITGGCQH